MKRIDENREEYHADAPDGFGYSWFCDLYRAWAGRLGARYMGAGRAQEYADRNGAPGEVVVRVRPERVVAMVDVAE